MPRLAEFTVRVHVNPEAVREEKDADALVTAINNLDLRRRIERLVEYELRERRVFLQAGAVAVVTE
jgi:hypothetical protein